MFYLIMKLNKFNNKNPSMNCLIRSVIVWLNVFLVALSIHYTILYDNFLTIINCLACVLPLYSIENNSIHGIFLYTIYVMIRC